MTIGIFLSTLAAFLGFGASIFFVVGSIRLSNMSILDLATPYWDYHSEIAATYAEQKWLYTVGAFLLILAFVAQAISLVPLEFGLTIIMSPIPGFAVAATIAIAFWIGAYLLSTFMIAKTVKAVDQMSDERIKQGEEEDRVARNAAESH